MQEINESRVTAIEALTLVQKIKKQLKQIDDERKYGAEPLERLSTHTVVTAVDLHTWTQDLEKVEERLAASV